MTSKVLVTGGTGMIGSALQSLLKSARYVSSSECDLRDATATNRLFEESRPEFVIHLAAKGFKKVWRKKSHIYFKYMCISRRGSVSPDRRSGTCRPAP